VLIVAGLGLGPTPAFSGPCPHALFEELEQAVQALGAEVEKRATVPAYRLLVEAACRRARRAESAPAAAWASAIQRLIEENVDDPEVGVRQIAEMAGLDRTTLAYRFRKATGVAPKEYLTALRLQRAMTLLRTTDLRVTDVAERCGFACANYFIKAFAKRVGTTPLRFRRRAV
jgi:AraC-like DNA-binding protein